jgi:hypothetical protein
LAVHWDLPVLLLLKAALWRPDAQVADAVLPLVLPEREVALP